VITTEATSRFRTDIQGLRAIAVGVVVLYHAGVPFLPGGYVGVDVFFVISGFLITAHLLSGLGRDGKVRFASFYARRARRILPASFAVLGLSVLAALIWYPPLLMREVWAGAVATAFYIPNYLFAAQGTNYLAETTPSLFQHYWSLGIEEQFYLIWPAFLAGGFILFKSRRALFGATVAVVVLSFAASVVLTFQSQPWAFFGLPTRAWELGIGGIVAFVLTYRPRPLVGGWAAALGWVGVVGIVACTVLFDSSTPFPGYWAALPALATAMVILGGDSSPQFGPRALLSTKPMMFVGLISYSLYLVHWPLLMVPQAVAGFENPLPLWTTLLLGAAAFPVAWVMYKYVEEPGRSGNWLAAARPRRTLLAAGAASTIVAVVATLAFAYSNTRPLHVNEAAPATVLSTPPAVTPYVPSNLQPTLRAASDDQPVLYDDGCHLSFAESAAKECVYGDPTAPRIILFGDSHAAQWFPALLTYAESNGYAVESHTKSSCPSVSADMLRNGVPYVECSTWRDGVVDRINEDDPALVVLANYGSGTFAIPTDDFPTAWGDALGKTIDAIEAPVVVLADTPDLRTTPSVCLSANLTAANQCGKSRVEALAAPTRSVEFETARQRDVPYIDLTDYICAADFCPPIVGNTLVYRDAHHLTATFSAEVAPALWAELDRVI